MSSYLNFFPNQLCPSNLLLSHLVFIYSSLSVSTVLLEFFFKKRLEAEARIRLSIQSKNSISSFLRLTDFFLRKVQVSLIE